MSNKQKTELSKCCGAKRRIFILGKDTCWKCGCTFFPQPTEEEHTSTGCSCNKCIPQHLKECKHRIIIKDKCAECGKSLPTQEPMEWEVYFDDKISNIFYRIERTGVDCTFNKNVVKEFIADQIKQAEERERERIVKEIEKGNFRKVTAIDENNLGIPKGKYLFEEDIINLINSPKEN